MSANKETEEIPEDQLCEMSLDLLVAAEGAWTAEDVADWERACREAWLSHPEELG